MFKVVIIDDESLITESLKLNVEWEQHGFEIVGNALNGIDGLQLILDTKPDVVFTDIRMPGLNGLELMKQVTKSHPEILFVVISGYAEFAYAQKAIKHGAIAYCLKPIEEEEVANVLMKAKEMLSKKPHNEKDNLLDLLEDVEDEQKVNALLKSAELDLEKNKVLDVAVFMGQGTLIFPEHIKYLTTRLDFNKKVYIFAHDETTETFLENQHYEAISIGIQKVEQLRHLKNAIIDATLAAYQFFISGRKGIFVSSAYDLHLLDNHLKKLDKAIELRDIALIEESYECIEKHFSLHSLNIRHAFKVYSTVMFLLFKYSDEELDTAIDGYEQLACNFENVHTMLEALKELSVRQCETSSNKSPDKIEHTIIKQVLEYVNHNFYKAITVQSLAEKFFISPNYISTLFKREVGVNFKDYLSKLRIDYACSQLINHEYSIQQVAEKSGYSDYFYFCRIFKSMTGYTPSKYRLERLMDKRE